MQEYEANFVSFHGKAYYPFNPLIHASTPLVYNPKYDLIFCFDFNVNPGVAVVCQEQPMPGQLQWAERPGGQYVQEPIWGTGVIGEVHIPQNSNTPAVCNKLLQDWGEHQGRIICYGDATGGSKGTSQIAGSDWDLVKDTFKNKWNDNVFYRIPRSNPRERVRVNSVNSRLMSKSGAVRLMIDPTKAPNLIRDFEGVRLLEGGSGEINKRADEKLTHLCFVAGTMVDTIDGNIPIEKLPEKGLIRTYDGTYVPFTNPGCRGEKETVGVELSNGEIIECTPDHRFLTENGWIEAKDSQDMLLYNKSMYTKGESSLWGRVKSFFREKYILGMGATTTMVENTQVGYTELFGNTIMGKFLKDIMCIIKMGTQRIMRYGISNVCLPVTTCGYIWKTPTEENWLEMPCDYHMWKRQQDSGTKAKKEENGIENMGQRQPVKRNIPIPVSSVEKNINLIGLQKPDSVAQNARWLIEKQTQTIMESVKNVVRNSQVNTKQSNTAAGNVITKTKKSRSISQLAKTVGKLFHIEGLNLQNTVPESAIIRIVGVKAGKKQKVYCPQVEKVGCFCLANGMVVSNSDACGYYIVHEFPIMDLTSYSREMLI
jgi:hypothetical protein